MRHAAQPSNEEIARQLKTDGYNSSVTASKMIREHGMSEADATALVGQIYGKKVSARTGDTTMAVLTGLGIATVGTIPALILWSMNILSIQLLLVALAFIGAGLTRAFIALVNSGSKEDIEG